MDPTLPASDSSRSSHAACRDRGTALVARKAACGLMISRCVPMPLVTCRKQNYREASLIAGKRRDAVDALRFPPYIAPRRKRV
jgi:hypothetical protein